jgi:hypothetical protein
LIVAGKYFLADSVYTDFTWAEDMATQGCDQSADPAAGMAWGGASRPPEQPFWRESDKSQGVWGQSPQLITTHFGEECFPHWFHLHC